MPDRGIKPEASNVVETPEGLQEQLIQAKVISEQNKHLTCVSLPAYANRVNRRQVHGAAVSGHGPTGTAQTFDQTGK